MLKITAILIIAISFHSFADAFARGPEEKRLHLGSYCLECNSAKKAFLGRIIRLGNIKKDKSGWPIFDIEFKVLKTFRGRTAKIEKFQAKTDWKNWQFYTLPEIGEEVAFCGDKWSLPLRNDNRNMSFPKKEALAIIEKSERHDSHRIEGMITREIYSPYTDAAGITREYHDYKAAPGITIEARGSGGKKFRATTHEDGSYQFENLPYGNYTLYPLADKNTKWELAHGGSKFEKAKVQLSRTLRCAKVMVDFVLLRA